MRQRNRNRETRVLKVQLHKYFNNYCENDKFELICKEAKISEADVVFWQLGFIQFDLNSLDNLYKSVLKVDSDFNNKLKIYGVFEK